MATKYGEERFGWASRSPRGAAGCGVWKGIFVKDWDHFSNMPGFGLTMARG